MTPLPPPPFPTPIIERCVEVSLVLPAWLAWLLGAVVVLAVMFMLVIIAYVARYALPS